jgi:hypothetical protein
MYAKDRRIGPMSSRVAEKSWYAFNRFKVDGSVRLHAVKDVIECLRSQTSMSDETLETKAPAASRRLTAGLGAERTGRQLNFLSPGFRGGKLECGDFSTLWQMGNDRTNNPAHLPGQRRQAMNHQKPVPWTGAGPGVWFGVSLRYSLTNSRIF